MKVYKYSLPLLFLLLIFATVVHAQHGVNKQDVFEQAGITSEQLQKADYDLQNLLYNELTQTDNKLEATPLAEGIPVIRKINGEAIVSAFVKSNAPYQTKAAIELKGGKVTNIIKDILIVEVPTNFISELISSDQLIRAEAARYQTLFMDTSLQFINVDKVHTGENLPKSYKGKGVVVGVLDSGIDWRHPAFSNENGNRIQYLWDMSDDSNPPTDFNYGTEYTKADLDQQNSDQIDDNGHGTHVASTAAGNAGGEDYSLDGVAPEADVVFVKGFRHGPGFASTDVVNGCDYIFKRADQLGKPAVINLSLGSVTGNKGTSLYEESLTNMIEPGKLIVASAGNSGSSNIHLKYEMSGTSLNEASQTFWQVGDLSNQNTYIIGYPQSNNYTFGIKVYSEDASELYYTSPEVSYGESESNLLLVVENDTLGVVTIDGRPQQGEPFANFIHLQYSSDANVDDYLFSYYTYGSSTLNAWIVNGSFSADADPANNIVGGDNLMTVGSPSSAFYVFSIGAFTTKTSWVNIDGDPYSVNGTIEDRAPFSSIGPLRDGRIKPDFSAPGHLIAAGYSSDANVNPATVLNEKTVLMQGTSMSAPHFTGVIALLLEQNSNLTYEEAFEVLQNTSVSDGLTGAVPNNEFGHGRVDAHAALQQLITSVENEEIPLEYNLSQNYPNPFNPSTIIEYSVPQNTHVSIKVYDLLGRDVATLVNETKSAGTYKVDFDGSNLSSGIYFYKINAGSFNAVRKMMLIK